MTTFRHSKVGAAFRTRTFGMLGALATAATACVTAPSPAAAIPLTYSISGPAQAFFGGKPAGIDTFNGSFVFDATPVGFYQPPTNAVLAVSGPIGPGFYGDTSLTGYPYLGGITFTKQGTSLPKFDFAYTSGLDALALGFFSSLGVMDADYTISMSMFPNFVSYLFPDAEGIRISIVPEPATLAILGGALGAFLLALGLNRRARRA